MSGFTAEEQAEADAVLTPRISDAELAELIAEAPPMSRRCIACAYRAGTEANLNPATQVSRGLCDRTGHPFFCHLEKNDVGLPRRLCAGWLEGRQPHPD